MISEIQVVKRKRKKYTREARGKVLSRRERLSDHSWGKVKNSVFKQENDEMRSVLESCSACSMATRWKCEREAPGTGPTGAFQRSDWSMVSQFRQGNLKNRGLLQTTRRTVKSFNSYKVEHHWNTTQSTSTITVIPVENCPHRDTVQTSCSWPSGESSLPVTSHTAQGILNKYSYISKKLRIPKSTYPWCHHLWIKCLEHTACQGQG